jgi:DNA-binding PucR family transcriptional regulator
LKIAARYLVPLTDLGAFGDTLAQTLETLFAHGMRIERTAAALYVHPNTLRHRLRRYEEETGADLRRTEDLLAIFWALERRRLDARGAPPRAAP